MEDITQRLALQVSEQLPGIIQHLLQGGFDPEDQDLQLQCHLTAGNAAHNNHLQVASVDIGRNFRSFSAPGTPSRTHSTANVVHPVTSNEKSQLSSPAWVETAATTSSPLSPDSSDSRPAKRRKSVGNNRSGSPQAENAHSNKSVIRRGSNESRLQQKKRFPDNPALQPSSLDKFINGIWDSLYSGIRMDPTEVIDQWQAIESNGQPRLLTDNDQEIAVRRELGVFGRMNVLARKISQTTKACRSLEVIVQAHWVQCFDEHVAELTSSMTPDKAKKIAIAEACVDFNWTEKELRNKMAIWKGYHDIKSTAGWAALVFAGMGLYRFCKYRVAFTEETFRILRHLRHRFEVAADTLHPRWRILLGIVGMSTDSKYKGHPHDWVVNGPGDEAIPLRQTYLQWDHNFSYVHLDNSIVDEDAWGEYDPRTVAQGNDQETYKCHLCGEQQSRNPTLNNCVCYPNLYGSPKAGTAPLQIFRTANGKNNGVIACCRFEKGWAVGEFVGEITAGIKGLDVMIDRTQRASYQIWQGRKGNHTRFINHSCEPNSQYERFVWLGKQRSVLVSNGIEAGEEITVDYGHTYWDDLDKACLCNKPNCRYRDRRKRQLITPPDESYE